MAWNNYKNYNNNWNSYKKQPDTPKNYDITSLLPNNETYLFDVESFAQTFMVTYKLANRKDYICFIKQGKRKLTQEEKDVCAKYVKAKFKDINKLEIKDLEEIKPFYKELASKKGVTIGFNSTSYDEPMTNFAAQSQDVLATHAVSDDLIVRHQPSWRSENYKGGIDNRCQFANDYNELIHGDLMIDLVEIFGLKRTQNAIGENIEETKVPFDIPNINITNNQEIEEWFKEKKAAGIDNIEELVDKRTLELTPKGLAETLFYNISDCNQTNRVLSFRYEWWKTKLQAAVGITDANGKEIVKGDKKLAHMTNASSSEQAFYKKGYDDKSMPLPESIRFDAPWLSKEHDYKNKAFKQIHNYFNSQPTMLRHRRTFQKFNFIEDSKKVVPPVIGVKKLNFFPEQIDCFEVDDVKFKTFLQSYKNQISFMNNNYYWVQEDPNGKSAKEKKGGEFFLPEDVLRWRIYNQEHPITDFNDYGHNLEKEYDLKLKRLLDPKEQCLAALKKEIEDLKKAIGPKTKKVDKDGKEYTYYLSELAGMEKWEKPFDVLYKNIETNEVKSEKQRIVENLQRTIKVTKNSKWVKTPSFSKGDRKLGYGTKTILWNDGEPVEQNTGFGGIHSAILNYEYHSTPLKDSEMLKPSLSFRQQFEKKQKAGEFKSAKDYDAFFAAVDKANKEKGYEFAKNKAWTELLNKYGSVDLIPKNEYDAWKTKHYNTCLRFKKEINSFKYGKVYTVDVASLYPSIIALRAKKLFPNDPYFLSGLFADLKKLRVSLKTSNASVAAVLKVWLNGFYGKTLYPAGKAFSPQAQYGIIGEGQEALIKLKDMLQGHCKEIQANTDGYYFHPLIGHEDIVKKVHGYDEVKKDAAGKIIKTHIAGEWEKLTGLDLEFEEHDWIVQPDVNNYLMGNYDADGKVDMKSIKAKGFMSSYDWIERYEKALKNLKESPNDIKAQFEAFAKAKVPEKFLSKNSLTIINKAVAHALMFDANPEDVIKKETNPLYFQQMVKLSNKYDALKQDMDLLHFAENRFIATTDNTGAIYKFKSGEPVKVKDIFEVNKKGDAKLEKNAKKLFNAWLEEKYYNLLNNASEHPEFFNNENFTDEQLSIIMENTWDDDLIKPYSKVEEEMLEEEVLEEKEAIIGCYEQFEEVFEDKFMEVNGFIEEDEQKETNFEQALVKQFVNQVKQGKIEGLEFDKASNQWVVYNGFQKSVYSDTPTKGAVLCNKVKDINTGNEWKIKDGYLYTVDGKKHQLNYDYYLNKVYQRLYAFNPSKYLTPKNIEKYRPDGKNKVLLQDIDKQIMDAKKRIVDLKEELKNRPKAKVVEQGVYPPER